MFDINKVIDKLKSRRGIFVSEADFQVELAKTIKKEYPKSIVVLESSPIFDMSMHIDVLVIIDNKWIPIELKYKTKECSKIISDELFNLKDHGAKDINCYLYLKDIERIEKFKSKEKLFEKGYAIFLTNDMMYTKKPFKGNVFYKEFSLEDGAIKKGIMSWKEGVSKGTIKNIEDPIKLKGEYKIEWKDYSKIDDSNSGMFKILINEIN